ncbi:hypothetical protein ALP8811_00598 [Aliiroseovarius pelagivivens]|uniref:Uncharacterized protein n=2 Tax=Aliiroseovarius pelagivivens TaxID=1639690 RepID=A0A2R8AHU5_9RHOB|nr:hypothetical protein ALP8811_00598 [Aliiroseovarius pelagivivens]
MINSAARIFTMSLAALATFSSLTLAGVWTESEDSPGEPVEFCIDDICEMTRYVLIGSTRGWAFHELANGYRVDSHFDPLTKLSTTVAYLGEVKLSAARFASVRLNDPGNLPPFLISVSEDGRFAKIQGEVTEQTAQEFQRLLDTHPSLIGVSLHSWGGSAPDAIIIGKAIWNRRLSTFIPEDGFCGAECAVLFLSGYDRRVEGVLEISPLTDPVVPRADLYSAYWGLMQEADVDFDIMGLYHVLEWNQTLQLSEVVGAKERLNRDLPGDALNH